MEDQILDRENTPKKGTSNTFQIVYRFLLLATLLYMGILFFQYIAIRNSMESPLLPSYTVNYIYYSFAVKGIILAFGSAFSLPFSWMRWNIMASSILLLTGVIALFSTYVIY